MLWLFALAAAPLLLGTPPPLQDLPNHLASAFIAEHLADYPTLELNGYLRSNSALALWLHLLGGPLGLVGAARLFLALVLAATAASLAWLGWTVGGPGRMASIALLGWPLVHHFFVATGLLNFSLSLAGAWTILALDHRRTDRRRPPPGPPPRGAGRRLPRLLVRPSLSRHPRRRTGGAAGRSPAPRPDGGSAGPFPAVGPLLPAVLLSVATAVAHLLKPATRPFLPTNRVQFDNPWITLGHLWIAGAGRLQLARGHDPAAPAAACWCSPGGTGAARFRTSPGR